ncbi:hypothetical protein L3X38_016725 [Prunus dulcis]|uniref:Uncharacterized protein n=1 Tax=Prunus dulcis TaxID=3755 RepID=A0AAD4W5Y6_PRUDU|nr:hypothetical protein L3X38_016725 [Prunus dulcis]
MAKLLLVSACTVVFVILLLELRLAYSSAEPQRPIKESWEANNAAVNTGGCTTKSKANFDKQQSDFGMAPQPPPRLWRPMAKGRDGDHPRTKPSPAHAKPG